MQLAALSSVPDDAGAESLYNSTNTEITRYNGACLIPWSSIVLVDAQAKSRDS